MKAAIPAHAVGMSPALHRLAGEDVPLWLAVVFAATGTLAAIVSASNVWPEQQPAAPAAPVLTAPVLTAPLAAVAHVAQPVPQQVTVPKPAAPPAPAHAPVPAAAAQEQVPAPPRPQAAPPAPAPCFTAINVPFVTNSARVTPAELGPAIAQLQVWMKAHPRTRLLLEGHADSSGAEGYNVVLSYSRAKAVATVLAENGIPAQRMSVAATGTGGAFGRSDPGERRVTLRIEGVDNCNATIGKGFTP